MINAPIWDNSYVTQSANTTATRLPEWFIGGPWHGRDKLADRPQQEFSDALIGHHLPVGAWAALDDPASVPQPVRFEYRRKTFAIGSTALTLWVAADLPESDASDKFAEILLAPHRIAPNVRIAGEVVRQAQMQPPSTGDKPYASVEGDLLRINKDNGTVMYRLISYIEDEDVYLAESPD